MKKWVVTRSFLIYANNKKEALKKLGEFRYEFLEGMYCIDESVKQAKDYNEIKAILKEVYRQIFNKK